VCAILMSQLAEKDPEKNLEGLPKWFDEQSPRRISKNVSLKAERRKAAGR
jgi:hypothetical protein